MNKLEIKRSLLASLLYLTNKALENNLNSVETMKLLNNMEQCKHLIIAYDRKEEIKEIGPNFKQQELF